MLILSRKIGDQIICRVTEVLAIGDEIVITLMEAGHGQAVIGIQASRSIDIERDNAKVKTRREARDEDPT